MEGKKEKKKKSYDSKLEPGPSRLQDQRAFGYATFHILC